VRAPRALAAIAGEAEALRSLKHPVLVRAFGVAQIDARPHHVLEYLDGPRLSTLVRRSGPLAAEQIVPLALQLSAALHYMHGQGWVHLDVKPRNVVMTAVPRLIDLSVARTFAAATAITGYVGTDAYMAPEQCEPDRFGEIGPKADVWGASVTLFEALTGVKAFPATGDQRFPQLQARMPVMPPKAPLALAEALQAGLDAEPANRPTATELYALLEPLSDWAAQSIRRLR
jgi:serine/threonine protein kinase